MKKRITSIMDKKKLGIAIISCIIISTITTGGVLAINTGSVKKKEKDKNSVHISEQKKVNPNKKCKKANEDEYSIYTKYGLTYNKEKNIFLYNGKSVRFFVDEKNNKGSYYFFTRPNGTVNIKAVRDKQNQLTGIKVLSKEEYEKLTNTTLKNNCDNSISEDDDKDEKTSEEYEEYKDDSDLLNADASLNEYLNYGVSYNTNKKQWLFANKPIRILIDTKNGTCYANSDIKKGVFVKVVRNSKGKIDKLDEMSENEVKKVNNLFIKNILN